MLILHILDLVLYNFAKFQIYIKIPELEVEESEESVSCL